MLVGRQPDLNTLLSEVTSLKTEVKAQSRQFKTSLETLSSALDTVQEDNHALTSELAIYADRIEQQKVDIMRTMLLEMIDIYDRLATGVDVLQKYRPIHKFFKQSRKKDIQFIKRFKEGQIMTLKRFENTLQKHGVRLIDCLGKTLDPTTMNAIETGHNTQLNNGVVLEELRKGFLYKDQVLRLSEVKVNKIKIG